MVNSLPYETGFSIAVRALKEECSLYLIVLYNSLRDGEMSREDYRKESNRVVKKQNSQLEEIGASW